MICKDCGFELWFPIANLGVSNLGFYNDARFIGRSILSIIDHHDYLEDVDRPTRLAFMDDIAEASRAIKLATKCSRVNVAILGNAEAHVHAHLIPRYPELEDRPYEAPWVDPRPKIKLDDKDVDRFVQKISYQIENGQDLSE